MRTRLLLLLPVAASACAPLPARPDPAADERAAFAAAAEQVRRCYRAPRIASEGRQIVTRLRVSFAADGQLARLPVLLTQEGVTPANRALAPRMAEAAIEAVLRCAPLALPPALRREGGISFDLTFSPVAPA